MGNKTIQKELRYLAKMVAIPLSYSPSIVWNEFFFSLLACAIPSLEVLVMMRFFDGIISGNAVINDLISLFVLFVLLKGIVWLTPPVRNYNNTQLENSLRLSFSLELIDKVSKLMYKEIENSKTWDLIERVIDDSEKKITSSLLHLLNFIAILIRVFGMIIILSSQLWWTGLVFLVLIAPLFLVAYIGGKRTHQADVDVSENVRKHKYLHGLLVGRESHKERSIFAFADFIQDKWDSQYQTVRLAQLNAIKSYFFRMKLGSLVTSIISLAILGVLTIPTLNGQFTFGLYIAVAYGLFELVNVMSWRLSSAMKQVAKNLGYCKDLESLMNLPEKKGATDTMPNGSMSFISLEFKNVWFSYNDDNNYILRDMSFKINSGDTCAFVGANGAGKTTVIKLILGLYDNYKGEILVNGQSIKTIPYEKLKSLFHPVFQDFYKYPLNIAENVTLGKDISEDSIHSALEQVDLLKEVISYPNKIHTQLGKLGDSSIDLSGGQWQRITLARAIAFSSPLMILDEPTASLDPMMECQMYEYFLQMSSRSTCILISHRLGATRNADKIFVIDDGKVIEKGDHNHLMSSDSQYSNMYNKQKGWYVYEL